MEFSQLSYVLWGLGMKGKGFSVFAIVFLFMLLFLEAEVQGAVSIQQDKEKYPIYKNMEVLEDLEGVLSIEDVSSLPTPINSSEMMVAFQVMAIIHRFIGYVLKSRIG